MSAAIWRPDPIAYKRGASRVESKGGRRSLDEKQLIGGSVNSTTIRSRDILNIWHFDADESGAGQINNTHDEPSRDPSAQWELEFRELTRDRVPLVPLFVAR